MEKTKKTAQIILCISLALMLLCGIVVNAVQTSGGKVAMRELTIETDSGRPICWYPRPPRRKTQPPPLSPATDI